MGAELVKDQFVEGEQPEQNAWLLFFRYKGVNDKIIEDRKLVICPGRFVYVLSSMVESGAKDRFRAEFQRFEDRFEALQ